LRGAVKFAHLEHDRRPGRLCGAFKQFDTVAKAR
jgi:hypothetical protein